MYGRNNMVVLLAHLYTEYVEQKVYLSVDFQGSQVNYSNTPPFYYLSLRLVYLSIPIYAEF